jgi:hypothetical protein
MKDSIAQMATKVLSNDFREIADKIESASESDVPAIDLLIIWSEVEDLQKKLRLYVSIIATTK